MATVSFFTEETSITSSQTALQAFGPLADSGNMENYNLENKFDIAADAPVYAITKGLILALANSLDSTLVNLVLLPINSSTAGLPIKFFIYRGIAKSSLINPNETIPVADSSWRTDNILQIIKDLQDKKNIEDNTPGMIATADSLGYQLSSMADTTYLEKLFFDNGQGFQPLIVDAGTQIGKFTGNTTPASVAVIMELIGKEPLLGLAKDNSNIFSIEKVNLNDPLLTPKQKMELAFKNRFAKEVVLSYIDLAAFYGACINQKIKVSGLSSTTPLQMFYGKDVVYIDIRDDYGFSYNHFFRFQDEVEYTVLPSGSSGTPTNFTPINYYESWPILRIKGLQYQTAKDYLWLKLPLYKLKLDAPFYLCSFTGLFYSVYDKITKRYGNINNNKERSTIGFGSSKPIRFWNWRHNDSLLGANYILLKVSYPLTFANGDTSKVWRDLFRVDMENIFVDKVFEYGEFALKNYASINVTITRDSLNAQVYTSVAGIAYDKEHVTLYTYKENIIYSENNSNQYFAYPLLNTGIYKKEYDIDDYDINTVTNPNIGFLSLWRNREMITNQTICKLSLNNESNVPTDVLTLNINGDFMQSDDVVNGLEIISFTRGEFDYLKNFQAGSFPGHPGFIRSLESKTFKGDAYILTEIELTLGFPEVIEDIPSGTLYVDIENSPITVQYNSAPISFTAVDYL